MTDQIIPAFVHESATTRRKLWGGRRNPDGPGGYVTFLTVQIATADLTLIDPTRPIEIHQEES